MKQLFIIFGIVFLFSCAADKNKKQFIKSVQHTLDSISNIYIPDSRADVSKLHADYRNDTVIIKGMTNRSVLIEATKNALDDNFTIVDSSLLLPDASVGSDTFGIVNISVANLRSSPEHSSQLVTQSLMGMPLKIYHKRGDWFLVRTIENYIAWLDKGGLVRMNKKEFDQWQESSRIIFTAVEGSAFASKGMDTIVSDFVLGDVVQLLEKGEILKLQLPDGRLAYANAENFKPLEQWSSQIVPSAEKTLEIARTLMGRPYLWGGTSVNGMDCSGYTKTIFLAQGLVIPRDASQQVKVGKKIPLNDSLSGLVKGDLIFFGNKRDDGSNRITHVAIYMGNGKIIHATGRVKIESLSPDDPLFNRKRYKTMLEARRYIGQSARKDLITVSESMYYE